MRKKRINAIVEARMGSRRLPGKTMMKILNKPVIELLIERLSYSKKIDDIILAIPENKEDDIIYQWALEKNIKCYRGASEDVLSRVYNAAKKYNTDIIVEVTGDCPLLDPWLIDECIEEFLCGDYDYLSNFIEQSYPPGIDVQIFNFETLERIYKIAKEDKFREHVTLYIIKNPDKFKIKNIKAKKEYYYPHWHIELDEAEDFELIKNIYEKLYPENKRFKTKDIINLLKNHLELTEINKRVQREWEKLREED